jgi:hypothetical protein
MTDDHNLVPCFSNHVHTFAHVALHARVYHSGLMSRSHPAHLLPALLSTTTAYITGWMWLPLTFYLSPQDASLYPLATLPRCAYPLRMLNLSSHL